VAEAIEAIIEAMRASVIHAIVGRGEPVVDLEGFETFTKRMVPLGKDPYVTIQKRGLLSFNKAAHVALGEPDAVELLFNAHRQVIAVRGVKEDTPHAYRFRQLGGQKNNSSTYVVGATAFTNHYGIPTNISRRYLVQARDGVIFIDLMGESTEVVGARGKRATKEQTVEATA
jgi:hypothetical protein